MTRNALLESLVAACLVTGAVAGASYAAPPNLLALATARNRMVDEEIVGAGVKNPRVIEAMRKTPRHEFVSVAQRPYAYFDMALPIGNAQTISPPFVVAYMTEQLDPQPTDKVLEIGTGSGYQTAILAELANEVVSIERHAGLLDEARLRLADLGYHNVTLIHGDGTLGWPEKAAYDRIMVTAAAAQCPPALFAQLAERGILVIPTGSADYQTLQAIHKVNGQPRIIDLSQCRFVPLVGAQGWPE